VWTLILAAVAAFLLYRQRASASRHLATGTFVCAALALAVSIYDLGEVSSRYSGIVHPGWGLYLATIASASLATAAFVQRQAVGL
jgi:hypothetical protein